MWDLKLFILEFNTYIILNTNFFFLTIINYLDPFFLNGPFFLNWKVYYYFAQNSTVFFAIKFLLSIAFLVLIRGGTPRYRYDYLTKLGWLKFLGVILSVFFFSLMVFFIF